ncbi:asparagine synthase-domain-containing protein [Lasiosphaeria ovina]|uniref:Asparagine synthase-domain-containing protein n=1 Tax=Lasiosphaeria ovina TaxID=92902 RepID=A0AAE0ND86_9PEZI|nr:asparagine synthase-domain-containing protein [Lasiosphaeria ovina]
MCGIHVAVSATAPEVPPELHCRLCNRGPDYLGLAERHVRGGSLSLHFTTTVLALRGDHVAQQPLVDPRTGSVLCWNGEAWRIDGLGVDGNDGEAILARLMKASASPPAVAAAPGSEREAAILDVFRAVEGPFSFVYFDAPTETLFFGRDRLGRRSLMIDSNDASGELTLSSIAEACDPSWKEVEADGIYVLRYPSSPATTLPARHQWIAGDEHADFVSSIGRFNKSLPSTAFVLTTSSPSVAMLKHQLLDSLRPRVLEIPQPPASDVTPSKARIAVLFSGGLDCAVLARLTHDLLEQDQEIDLVNVAFENPRVVAQLRKDSKGGELLTDFFEICPDRITGRKSFAELQAVCPGRVFRFVAVNVPYSETLAHRSQVVSLMYPHNTEMDLSIAFALYFAARGRGLCYESSSSVSQPAPYTCSARVLLSGLGADELFGGYGRHMVAFSKQGYAGLADELLLDVSRLGKRNLGRDDRVMTHWSKEVRFPFLDERLVKWAIETPSWEKCDFENGEGFTGVEAGKRVLRLLALALGMENVAKEKKRAIQFGSRTAKMENGRVKGTTTIV